MNNDLSGSVFLSSTATPYFSPLPGRAMMINVIKDVGKAVVSKTMNELQNMQSHEQ